MNRQDRTGSSRAICICKSYECSPQIWLCTMASVSPLRHSFSHLIGYKFKCRLLN
uniref:Uncharacterized protein n=1 Tax=Anguilla anguilla TaxID=7936 RepID=A0A0E9RCN4_ANGAN